MMPEFFMFPASFGQQRLWFLDQMMPGNSFYNLTAPVRLSFSVNALILKKSLNEIVRRHEILRTTFKEIDGKPFQVIASSLELDLQTHDYSHLTGPTKESSLQQLVKNEARTSFDLAKGPLLRTALVKYNDNDYIFILTMHHIISDGWSRFIFFRELSLSYESYSKGKESPLPELPIQYADYSVWQIDYLKGKVLDDHLSYWKQKLSDLPTLDLPTDFLRPKLQTFHGAFQLLELSKQISDGIKKIAQNENVTVFMTLLAIFSSLLQRYSSQNDIVLGVPVANRNKTELENLIGFFVNSIVIRADLSGSPTFSDLLKRIKVCILEAFEHEELPFEKLVEELQPNRDLSRNPLFQVSFQYLQFPNLPGTKNDKKDSSFLGHDKGTAIFDLRLSFADNEDVIGGEIEYSTDLFEAETIKRMAEHFSNFSNEVGKNSRLPVREIDIISEWEKDQLLVGWNNTTELYQESKSLHKIVEQRARLWPDSVVVKYREESLTFSELNEKANQLANFLRASGTKEGSFVGVCLERSEKLIITFLGILKAGAAYIPLDPAYPKDRLQTIVEDSGMHTLITESHRARELQRCDTLIVFLDDLWASLPKFSKLNLDLEVKPSQIAYVIYTSGSTGKPKGVLIPHSAICNHMLWMNSAFPLRPDDKVMQRTPYSFDASVWEFYAPLIGGGQLFIAEDEGNKDPEYLVQKIISEGITIIQMVPTLLKSLLEHPKISDCIALRRVYCGGEKLSEEVVISFHELLESELYNLYGPTECTIDSTVWHCLELKNDDRVPIGKPISNTQLYVLDDNMKPAPIGVPGELWIGGAGLALGYLNSPRLTADKFRPNPFAVHLGERIYRTGDLVRYRSDGNLEYIGRLDKQVKLHGYRIELSEIEVVLKTIKKVHDAVVLTQPDINSNDSLVAYVIVDGANVSESEKIAWESRQVHELKECVSQILPEYMMPSDFVFIEKFPLQPNGKIDLQRLSKVERKKISFGDRYEPPSTFLEKELEVIWSNVLGIKKIGVNDNFFRDLGGNSLLATQLTSRIRNHFVVGINLTAIFNAPTIKKFSELLQPLVTEASLVNQGHMT